MINPNKEVLKTLQKLMKEAGKKYSIRIGIIGDKASQIHEGTSLTNAELGAIHEFGATINVTPKMRNYLHAKGLHLNNNTHTIVIPTRSFLRMPLLSPEGKRYIISQTAKNYEAFAQFIQAKAKRKGLSEELQEFEKAYKSTVQTEAKNLIDFDYLAQLIASFALKRVQEAFESGGFGKWAKISPYTEKHRINDPSSPPLTDSGDLMRSITVEVKKFE